MTSRSDSESRASPRFVEPFKSEKKIVTVFRVSCFGSSGASAVPQNPQRRNFGGFSSPQLGQICTNLVYGAGPGTSSQSSAATVPTARQARAVSVNEPCGSYSPRANSSRSEVCPSSSSEAVYAPAGPTPVGNGDQRSSKLIQGLDDDRGHVDVAQSSALPQRRELVGAGEAHGVSLHQRGRALRVERSGCLPEGAKHRHLAAVVPHAAGDDSVCAGHPGHLPQPLLGIVEKIDDELRQRRVELAVAEEERLGRADENPRLRDPNARRLDERLGRIDGGDVVCPRTSASRATSAPEPQPTSSARCPSRMPAAAHMARATPGLYRPMNRS